MNTKKNKLDNNSIISLLKTLICGFVIGVAGIIPGLSGGVLAVSMGIYPRLINSVINIRKEFKKSVSLLIPFGISALCGMFLFGVIMKPLLENFERSIIWLFIGLILGSIPSFIKEANQKGFRITYVIPMVISFALGIFLATLTEQKLTLPADSPLMLFLCGGILAIGAVVPGMSSSFVLMQMGMYDKVISAFVTFDWLCMLCVSLGAVVLFVTTVKLVNAAFEKFHGYAYFTAFGFLISTIVSVFPGVNSIGDILLLVIGLLFIFAFNKFANKKMA